MFSSPLSDLAVAGSTTERKKGNIHEFTDPTQKNNSTISHRLCTWLFWLTPMAQAVGPDTEGAIAGSNNGEGVGVLVSRTTGIWNTGTGFEVLHDLTVGNQNTATGVRALFSDTSGSYNTATGVYSLFGNTSGFYNSATGAYSLATNTSGSDNTANGYGALYFNTTGDPKHGKRFCCALPQHHRRHQHGKWC